MKWFKFYGQDFLTDPKMLNLTPIEKSIWITILSLASQNEGVIEHVDCEKILIFTGIFPSDPEFEKNYQFLERFEALQLIKCDNASVTNIITVSNFNKRQGKNFSNAEKQKRYRDRKKSNQNEAKTVKKPLRNDSGNANNDSYPRIDKNRIDKNKETNTNVLVKKSSPIEELSSLTEEDLTQIAERYQTTLAFVRSKLDDLDNWIAEKPSRATGRNLKRTLMSWVKRDAIERRENVASKSKITFIDPE